MSVLPNDIKFFPSDQGIGGGIDQSDEIAYGALNGLFDAVRGSEAIAGMTDYRCIYISNASATDTLRDVLVYLTAEPTTSTISIEIGLGIAAGGIEPPTADENSAPAGVFFTRAFDVGNALNMGDLAPGGFRSLWIKRTVSPNTPPVASDSFALTVAGETD